MFLGTDDGLYISVNAGEKWTKWTEGFPTVSVKDLAIQEREHDLIIGTFAKDGPLKCSGIEITQYSDVSLKSVFDEDWDQMENLNIIHPTPFNTEQAFVFSRFLKRG